MIGAGALPAPRRARALVAGLLLATGGASALAESPRNPDPELGRYLASECVTCHQLSGQAAAGVPAIVGWPEDQFIAVLKSYKNKDRDNAVMQTVAASLTEDDMAALAAYFGDVKQPTEQRQVKPADVPLQGGKRND